MPITKSAKKALRQNITRRTRNIKYKKSMKDTVKLYRKFLAQKKTEEARKMLPKVFQVLDKTVKAGVIKKNTANRLKSRLSQKVSVKK
ncbi:MAG TPA: 30S ribosomal protein S20 [Candidatus Paceibacterota bacterium]